MFTKMPFYFSICTCSQANPPTSTPTSTSTSTPTSSPIVSFASSTPTYTSTSIPTSSPTVSFASPGGIDGDGVSGETSFDVEFWYTGSYLAAAHGLVPATVTSGSVGQDTDKTFDRNDGNSTLHQFALSAGVAHFRIAMPPHAAGYYNDLDRQWGETSTIDLSWTGATVDAWDLGVVSHTGDTGLIGWTYVNVDNLPDN